LDGKIAQASNLAIEKKNVTWILARTAVAKITLKKEIQSNEITLT